MNILKLYNRYRKAFKNPISVMLSVYNNREAIPVICKKTNLKRIWNRQWIFAYADVIDAFPSRDKELVALFDSFENFNQDPHESERFATFDFNKENLKFYGVLKNGMMVNGDLIGVFFTEDYKFLDPKGSIVIYIGANIGDSAIYFALNGAEKVIALEPYPHSYNIAQKNVETNNFNDKVELLNAGYGKDSNIIVNHEEISGVGSNLISAEKGKSIPIISLKTLVNRYNVNDGVLKIDCEGCEYNLINEDGEVLRRFSRIQIEYHYGLQTLVNKLESCGFSIRYSKPRKYFSQDSENHHMLLGFIYAQKLI
jgi:FkbM family methyltransferase